MPGSDAERLIADLGQLIPAFEAAMAALDPVTEQGIRATQAQFLGRKGLLSEKMKALGRLPAGDRPAVGEAANRAKAAIEEVVAAQLGVLGEKALAGDLGRTVDVTLPGRGAPLGTLHPLTRVRREVEEIFLGLG